MTAVSPQFLASALLFFQPMPSPLIPNFFGPLSFHSPGFFVAASQLQVKSPSINSLVPHLLTHLFHTSLPPALHLQTPSPVTPTLLSPLYPCRGLMTQLSCDKYELNPVWHRESKETTRDGETGQNQTSICSCIQSRKEVVRL